MEYTLYRYSGYIKYELYAKLSSLISELEDYVQFKIQDESYYNLNQQIFKYPLFSGYYDIDHNDNTITFHYHCYDLDDNKIDKFNEYMDKKFWQPKVRLHGYTDILNRITKKLDYKNTSNYSTVVKVSFTCDEDDLDEYLHKN